MLEGRAGEEGRGREEEGEKYPSIEAEGRLCLVFCPTDPAPYPPLSYVLTWAVVVMILLVRHLFSDVRRLACKEGTPMAKE